MFRDTSNSGRLYRQMQALLAGEPTNDVIVAAMNTLALAVGASVADLDAAKKVFDAAYSDATAAMIRNFELAQSGRGLGQKTGNA